MTNLSILYNTNLVPLAICALPPPGKPKQQGPNAKELQEEDTSILQEGRKREKKLFEGLLLKKST